MHKTVVEKNGKYRLKYEPEVKDVVVLAITCIILGVLIVKELIRT